MLNRELTFTVGLTTKDGALLVPSEVIRETAGLLAEYGWPGVTVTEHVGYWKGEQENSLSFTVAYDTTGTRGFDPLRVAEKLAYELDQEAVLYVVRDVVGDFGYARRCCDR